MDWLWQMRAKLIVGMAIVFALPATVAMASYCAIFAWGKQCDYATYDECLRAAGSRGGCEINPRADDTPAGTAQYCLVTLSGRKCIYDEAPACRMAAAIHNSEEVKVKRAECVVNPDR